MEPRMETLSRWPGSRSSSGTGLDEDADASPPEPVSQSLCLGASPIGFTWGKLHRKLSLASGPHLLYPCDFTALRGYSETRQRESQRKTNMLRKKMYIFSHYLNNETISSGKFGIISWKIIGMNSPI